VITGIITNVRIIEKPRPNIIAKAKGPQSAEAPASGPGSHDGPDGLVARDDGKRRVRQVSLDDVEVRPADAARPHAHEDLVVPRDRVRDPPEREGPGPGRAAPLEDHRLHRAGLTRP